MKWFIWCFSLSLLIVSHAPAFADQTVRSQIIKIFTGFNRDQFGIITVAPIINPANCRPDGNDPTGYMSESSRPGYQTFYAAALLAFAERADVEVVADDEGCVAERFRLIGLNILR